MIILPMDTKCRLCGLIFCEDCTAYKDMLPLSWGQMDPQRVCVDCHNALEPIQQAMSECNANALRVNTIENQGLWRYINRPLNFTIGGEVRKVAYSVQNLIDGVEAVIEDEAVRAKMLTDAEALLFVTTAKVAFVGGVKFGTGLLVNKLPGTEMGWSAPCVSPSIYSSIHPSIYLYPFIPPLV